MGAEQFMVRASGESMRDAFKEAVEDALYDNGHSGYSGSIAEKSSFVAIPIPKGEKPVALANKLLDEDDSRISDKWGDAGGIDCGDGTYIFFGWASS